MPADDDIARIAKARVGFKTHAAVYLIVNLFLAGTWLAAGGLREGTRATYWPLWTHLGWGLGLAIHGYFTVGPGQGMQEREERRLRERLGR